MKTLCLSILLLCTLIGFAQTNKRPKTPVDILYGPAPDPRTWDGKSHGPIHVGIFNPRISNLEEFEKGMESIPSKPTAKTISGRVEIQLLVNEDGDVIFTNPLSGPAALWADCVKAAVGARFQPMKLEGKPTQQEGRIIFDFRNGDLKFPLRDFF